MPEETPPKTDIAPDPKTISVAEPSSAQNAPLQRRHIVAACAAALCISFFLPWLHVLFATPSGFDISKGGGNTWVLWSMPVFALLACLAGVTGKNYKAPAILAGVIPFGLLLYSMSNAGGDGMQFIQSLAVGAWLALGLGAVLVIAALK